MPTYKKTVVGSC